MSIQNLNFPLPLKWKNYLQRLILYISIKDIKRRRRSKHEQEGRDFACDCGKSFLSQPALNNHKKTKHPELLIGQPKRGRGRPRKYPPKSNGDFEATKYDIFFNQTGRSAGNSSIDVLSVIKEVFSFIYESPSSNKLFSKPKSYKDNPVLADLAQRKSILDKPKKWKNLWWSLLWIFS